MILRSGMQGMAYGIAVVVAPITLVCLNSEGLAVPVFFCSYEEWCCLLDAWDVARWLVGPPHDGCLSRAVLFIVRVYRHILRYHAREKLHTWIVTQEKLREACENTRVIP